MIVRLLLLCFIPLFSICENTFASPKGIHNLLPQPQYYKAQKGHFTARKIKLIDSFSGGQVRQWISKIGLSIDSNAKHTIEVSIVDYLPLVKLNSDEAYRLSISTNSIVLSAHTETGLYRGLQTLAQLWEQYPFCLPACEIVDWPAWRIRGFMHDVGRTYIPMEELKKQIQLFSYFKVNVFHWHLTENQAWRLESKIYPQLNGPEYTTRMPGKYYTLKEAKELVEWCKQHHVLLIPEIDMPGHSKAFERAMGFGMQTEQGKITLKELLAEAVDAMDVPYIHIGTDEVEFTDSTFVPEMVAYVRSLGRKVISWNPGWQYKPSEIDMTHLWSYRGKAQSGIPAIDSRLHYTNHYDLFADVRALYNSTIYESREGSPDLAGTILAIWNDRYIPNTSTLMRENNLYPTVLAMAERAWLGGGYGYFDRNTNLFPDSSSEAYKEFSDFERRFFWHKEHTLSGEKIPYIQQSHASWVISDAFPNGGDLEKVFPPERIYLSKTTLSPPPKSMPSYIFEGKSYESRQFFGSGFYLRHVWGNSICPAVYDDPKENHTAYAMTWVYSDKNQNVGLLFETQNYSRSESDLPPPHGEWDYRKSRIWINQKEIPAPEWSAKYDKRDNEIPLGNENIPSREPISITLCKGWNHVLIKLPVSEFLSKEIRLVKWMFTASFVDSTGSRVANIRYHHFPTSSVESK
ncbi:MAG: family 20 glycosylhydrolase [Porphyromonas sp.]|nr:family 20 glycosylhydrolase [Porphyromonas sp.]